MSLFEYIGRVGTGILTPDEDNCKMVRLPHPILTNTQLDLLCNIRYKGFNTVKLPILFECAESTAAAASNLRRALSDLCRKAEKCVDDGVNYIILSDRDVDKAHAPIPSLLAVSAVHHHLIATARLRRLRHQPISFLRNYLEPDTRRQDAAELCHGARQLYRGDEERPAENHGQDGYFHHPFLSGRPDIRERRPG